MFQRNTHNYIRKSVSEFTKPTQIETRWLLCSLNRHKPHGIHIKEVVSNHIWSQSVNSFNHTNRTWLYVSESD